MQEEGWQAAGLEARKSALLAEWLAQTLASYPEPARHFLAQEKDRFRNPVGYTLREGLASLVEELLGGMDPDRLRNALEGIVRVRAVQDMPPREALAFLPALKAIARRFWEQSGPGAKLLATLDRRVDEALLLAVELYVRCREQMAEIKLAEVRRRYFVAERAGWLSQ